MKKETENEKKLKTVVATVLATAAMTITALAGSASYNSTFTVYQNETVRPLSAYFSAKSDHTMNVQFGTVYSAGDTAVGISSKEIFGNYKSLASSTFYLKKGNYTGVNYFINFDNISKGTRYYGFTTDLNTKYSVKSFSDSW